MATILRKLLAAGATVTLVAGISGCGGGDDQVDQSDHNVVVEAKETAETELAAAETELAALKAQLAQLVAAGTADDAEIAALKAQISGTEGERDTLQGEIDDTKKEADSAKAEAILYALNIAGGDNDEDPKVTHEVWESIAPMGMVQANNQVKHERASDGTLTTTVFSYTAGDPPADMIEGWMGSTLTKGNEEVVTYTDIDSAKATAIAQLYDGDRSGVDEPVAYSVINEPAEDDVDAINERMIWWSDARRTDTDVTTTGTGADAVHEFAGTVSKLPGTFSCVGVATDCTAPTTDPDGKLENLPANTQGWTFAPDDAAGTIDVADSEYLTLGWWLNKRKDADDGTYRLTPSP